MDNAENVVGKIFSIACRDFVTYDYCIFYPGKNLNLVIGPNGTGKSTLVAAIMLGMGGTPKLLSRSGNLGDYVKNGKEIAWIQVKIHANNAQTNELMVFERSFALQGKSVWKIDGSEVSQKEYLLAAAAFNIQVDNLCQFLPQDRVQDFAKMNPQEILENTQSSVCPPEMAEKLSLLKELRHTQLNSKNDHEKNAEKLKEEEKRTAELQQEIERMAERKKFLEKVDICLQKKAWLEIGNSKENLNKVKTDLKSARDLLERDRKLFAACEKQSHSIVEFFSKMDEIIKSAEESALQHSDHIATNRIQTENLQKQIRYASRELEDKKKEEFDRVNDVTREINMLEILKQDLILEREKVGSEELLRNEINDSQQKLDQNRIQHQILMENDRKLRNQLDEDVNPELVAIKNKITTMENSKDRKLNTLKSDNPDVYKAVLWLRENHHLFQEKIYEPMLIELNPIKPEFAMYIENTVSKRDLLCFTAVNKADMNAFIKYVCNEQRLKINIVFQEKADRCRYVAQDPIETLHQYGFFSYLSEMIEGPAPILNYLCTLYKLHVIPVGGEEVYRNTSNIPKKIRTFYAPKHCFSVSQSRYSREYSSMQTQISGRNILLSGFNRAEYVKLQQKLNELTVRSDAIKNQRSQIQGEVMQNETERNEILLHKKALEKTLGGPQELKEKLKRQQIKIEQLKSKKIDIAEKEIEFKNKTIKIFDDLKKVFQNQQESLALYQDAMQQRDYNYTKLHIFKCENASIENKLQATRDAFNNSKRTFDTITHKYEKDKAKLNENIKKAKDMSGGKVPNDPDFPKKEEYIALPSDVQRLDEIIDELEARAETMEQDDPRVIEEFTTRVESIKKLRKAIEKSTYDDKLLEEQMTMVHTEWYSGIMEKIKVINKNFSHFMASMEFAGEVQLVEGETTRDYSNYGIKIMVQYRNNTKLQALDRFVQSGGERAVAIAIYTLSMQHIANVPFRCVDEINQGMDPKNERKVFEMLVEETAKTGKSQYFFITPKLLPTLPYTEYVTVHIVHNAKFIKNHNVFNWKKSLASNGERQ